MRVEGRAESENVEDRRMSGGSKVAIGGGLGAIVIALITMFLGGDPTQILQGGGGAAADTSPPSAQEEELARFVKVTLGYTEDVWSDVFARAGRTYKKPILVLYRGGTETACGTGQAAMGPFYCPGDGKLYIDLSFYNEMKTKYGASGDFALAYVVAHEVGHHIQNLLGYSDKVHQMRGRVSEAEYNQASVRLELQADFLAGVWAHYVQKKGILEAGDIEEAMRAAAAVGDDKLQKQARGYVVPDSFTHGTSAQRARWFNRGMESGDMTQGDTFNIPYQNL